MNWLTRTISKVFPRKKKSLDIAENSWIKCPQTALKILGASAELSQESRDDAAKWIKGFMFSYAGPIYAGTNEIQKNIIAERLLGLPR